MTEKPRVLFVGMTGSQASPFEEALSNRGVRTQVEPDPETASQLLLNERYNAIVASYPLPTGDLGRLISTVRTRSASSVGAGLVLLAPPANLRAANGLKGRGVYRVLSCDEKPVVLAIVVEQTIEQVQPMVERLSIRLPVTVKLGDEAMQCETENLCGRGMLVVGEPPPPVGTRFGYILELPAGTVAGEAQVVRWVSNAREQAAGFGARFCEFDGEGRSQLLSYLRGVAAVNSANAANAANAASSAH